MYPTPILTTCVPFSHHHRVEGRVDQLGYYCYAYDFLDIDFKTEDEPIRNPTPAPIPTPPADISLVLTCSYTKNGMTYDCESINFTQLQGLTSCGLEVTFSYSVVNRSNGPVKLSALLDSALVNLANNEVLDPFTETKITRTENLNICQVGGTTIEKTAYALASPVSGGAAASARDDLRIDLP